MLISFKKNLILSIGILLIFLTFVSCRSTIKQPLTQTVLNNFEQIPTLTRDDPDSRGIITYDTYQILVADGIETISKIANRLGINNEELALYNGLIPNYRPRKDEIVAIPQTRFISSSGWSTEITRQSIKEKPVVTQKISEASNPLRHRVTEGETVYSLARKYNVSVNSLATWNGLGPDLDIKTGREIIIPAAATTARGISDKKAGNPKRVEQVKSDTTKSTKNNQIQLNPNSSKIDKEDNLRTSSTILNEKSPPEAKVISIRPFIAPVVGKIVNHYTQNKGNNNNNGIDYETTVFQKVKAVSNGTVVLISDIVGGSGKIMLIRHQGELITIYGRLTNVTVKKGQKVNQGEKVGEVMEDPQTQKGLMHFEVRKGMKSIDPTTMIR